MKACRWSIEYQVELFSCFHCQGTFIVRRTQTWHKLSLYRLESRYLKKSSISFSKLKIAKVYLEIQVVTCTFEFFSEPTLFFTTRGTAF